MNRLFVLQSYTCHFIIFSKIFHHRTDFKARRTLKLKLRPSIYEIAEENCHFNTRNTIYIKVEFVRNYRKFMVFKMTLVDFGEKMGGGRATSRLVLARLGLARWSILARVARV